MENRCELCQYFVRSMCNTNVGDCRCVASKYYRDTMALYSTCQYFAGKEKKKVVDNFMKYFKDITSIAERFSRIWSNKFVVDELINAAWVGYDAAIINKPLLAHKSFKKGYFLRKIKCLMKDYIRQETKIALQERLIEKGLTVPTFVSCDGRHMRGSLDSCGGVDKQDFFDELFNQVVLEEADWKIIQGYFYENKVLRELGTELDLTESGVSIRKDNALMKLRKVAERILSS